MPNCGYYRKKLSVTENLKLNQSENLGRFQQRLTSFIPLTLQNSRRCHDRVIAGEEVTIQHMNIIMNNCVLVRWRANRGEQSFAEKKKKNYVSVRRDCHTNSRQKTYYQETLAMCFPPRRHPAMSTTTQAPQHRSPSPPASTSAQHPDWIRNDEKSPQRRDTYLITEDMDWQRGRAI